VNNRQFIADCKTRIVGLETIIAQMQNRRLAFGNAADERTMSWIERDEASLVLARKQLADAEKVADALTRAHE